MTLVKDLPVNQDLAVSNSIVPAGVIFPFAGTGEPTGWLLCDGRAVSRATYAALFAALGGSGTPWGTGDGTTTFNLPDYRGRVPVGAASMGTAAGTAAGNSRAQVNRGTTGGEQLHTLTAGESGTAVHNHGVTDPSHIHTFGGATLLAGPTTGIVQGGTGASISISNGGNATQTAGSSTGVSVNNHAGASASGGHNNLPPYQACLWIVKY